MKILWVKSGGLFPPDTGGKIRSYHILCELSRKHQVTLFLSYDAEKHDRHKELEPQFARLICRPVQLAARGTWAARSAYVRNFFSTQPHSVARFCRPDMLDALRRLTSEQEFDVIVCDFVMTAPVIPWEANAPKILFAHNVETALWRRYFRVARNPVRKLTSWREYQTMLWTEREYAHAADHVLTVSEVDRQFFSEFVGPDRTTTIPTGVDLEYFQPLRDAEEDYNIVFTGSMDWPPNEDGVLFFSQRIFPLIQQSIPHSVVWIVGRNPSGNVLRLARQDPAIRVTGTVKDIRPYVNRAAVYVVPLRVGGGTRLKIFEAMAMGKAVVSTTIGAEGLPVTDGHDILIADAPEHFAERTIRLLQDRSVRDELGNAARKLVEPQYGWARVASDCEIVFERAIQQFARRKGIKPAVEPAAPVPVGGAANWEGPNEALVERTSSE